MTVTARGTAAWGETLRRSTNVGAAGRVAGVLVPALLAACVVPPPPSGDPTWPAPALVSGEGWEGIGLPEVAVDRKGDALLAWETCGPTFPSCDDVIQVRRQPATGAPGQALTLSESGVTPGYPAVAADDDGDAAVVWEQRGGIVGRRISSGDELVGPVQQLSTSSPTTSPAVAVAPEGTALATWSEIRDGSWYALARRISADGSIGPAIMLGPGNSQAPAVGVDRGGRFVVAWGIGSADVAASRIEGDAVNATQVLTSTIASSRPFGLVKVGVDGDGDAVISHLSGGGGHIRVWASRWSRTGTVDAPVDVSSPTDNSGLLHTLATDLEGDTMLLWTRQSGHSIEVLGRQMSRTGTLGEITSLGECDEPNLAVDDDGDGVVVCHSPGRPYSAHDVVVRPFTPTGSFGTATTLSSDGHEPQVAAGPSSRFTVIWQQVSYPYSMWSATGS